jgi:hypothetical protein
MTFKGLCGKRWYDRFGFIHDLRHGCRGKINTLIDIAA